MNQRHVETKEAHLLHRDFVKTGDGMQGHLLNPTNEKFCSNLVNVWLKFKVHIKDVHNQFFK